MNIDSKTVLITGGTGSLGKVLTRRLLTGELGSPKRIIIFSRDEGKQHDMRLAYLHRTAATDDVIYDNFRSLVEFRIGDVRDFSSVADALLDVDVVFNAAALKQVPTCEYMPHEAVLTNVIGAHNIVRAIREVRPQVETVVGISTDKACKPVNVMGMTKSLQERILIAANLRWPGTRFVCVRYGNVLASRGSVIPLFHSQIQAGGPVTITSPDMTRFLLSLDDAVDVVFAVCRHGRPGETYVPRVPSALVTDIAAVMIGDRQHIDVVVTGIRPGEKVHEILVSEEEALRTVQRRKCLAIRAILPELRDGPDEEAVLDRPLSSADNLMSREELRELLEEKDLLSVHAVPDGGELLR